MVAGGCRLRHVALCVATQVEATKFTEVGYHGRDVDSIIKDLVEASIGLVKTKLREQSQVRQCSLCVPCCLLGSHTQLVLAVVCLGLMLW